MIFRGFLKGNSQIMPILGQKYPHRTASASASARKPEKAIFRAEVRCGADRADAVRPRGSRLVSEAKKVGVQQLVASKFGDNKIVSDIVGAELC